MKPVLGMAAGYQFQEWLRRQVRGEDSPAFPVHPGDVATYQEHVRRYLAQAIGPAPSCDRLDPILHQVRQRDGYRIEAVSFGTFGGLRMTATAYVPDAPGPHPAVLATHGHAPHGRRHVTEQRRCVDLARRGYFVLAVDSFGSGERSITLPGSYHGGIEGASLWLTGDSLFSIQVHENARAVDYMLTRPEVDPDRLAITGASGGGNQALYSGAWDPRFKVVIPVVSMGSYRKMIGANNCVCETPFGLAAHLEQYDVLALMAPRPVLVLSAMDDSLTFRHEEAAATVAKAAKVWGLLGFSDHIRFEAFPTGHGYHTPMINAAHAWLDRWLRGSGVEGDEVPEPTETYASISCFPHADEAQVKMLPDYRRDRQRSIRQSPRQLDRQGLIRLLRLERFVDSLAEPLEMELYQRLHPMTGVGAVLHGDAFLMPLFYLRPDYRTPMNRLMIWAGDRKEDLIDHPALPSLLAAGWHVWIIDLPGLGEATLPYEPGDTQSNAARACHMLGTTLAGLWVVLLARTIATGRAFGAEHVAVAASGTVATPGLIGSALLGSADRAIINKPVARIDGTTPFENLGMGLMIPDLLLGGGPAEWASLRAPLPLAVIAPRSADGSEMRPSEAVSVFSATRHRYIEMGSEEAFRLLSAAEGEQVSAWGV